MGLRLRMHSNESCMLLNFRGALQSQATDKDKRYNNSGEQFKSC